MRCLPGRGGGCQQAYHKTLVTWSAPSVVLRSIYRVDSGHVSSGENRSVRTPIQSSLRQSSYATNSLQSASKLSSTGSPDGDRSEASPPAGLKMRSRDQAAAAEPPIVRVTSVRLRDGMMSQRVTTSLLGTIVPT